MILWLFYIIIDAIANWYMIEKKKSVPDYLPMTLFRGLMLIVIGSLVFHTTLENVWQWILFSTTSFWLLFDILINLLRGKNIFYRGENSAVDKFGRKYPAVYFILKLTALLILIYQL